MPRNHRAIVYQRGTHDETFITQNAGNVGGILQLEAATNAVAILEQSGDRNTLYITQNQPGQYLRVQQTGSNNAVTGTVRTERSNTGGTGGTTTTTAPAFGGVR